MVSFKTSAALVAAAVLSLGAQAQYTYYIDPNSVPLSTRTSWCQSQIASCPLLCLQLSGQSSTTESNSCDPASLNYECICGNGLAPNAANYSQTIPYFECTEYGNQCVAGCNGNSACQTSCRVDHPCGAQDPTRINATSTTSSSTASSTSGSASGSAAASSGSDGVRFTGLGGAAATSSASSSSSTSSSTSDSKKSGSQAALDLGRSYGLAVVFAGLFAGFALVM
ncbi:hypothetical protein M430DRAFT_109594 [Amorphotheca resinae ATCC 22711]|uniref:DUF7707 domain-containing protein n=1 Tax=Amorphotheca resinae ATCC 22711 TaxID=857342 RepID=A0A2T3AR96_AMORE|nr:hypothetical protein M430DRAFT_109594 [Amorphotheca resinae ATCC 22711]PSS08784.1 hypothetical protein M430DRAFT_109594 [Amorphotheca resinae ATCC 22711]